MTRRVDPVVKRLDLAVEPARAFDHFTGAIGTWWPLATHSLGQDKARTVIFEAYKDGRIYEIEDMGREREWGRVLRCEPPHLLVFRWVLERPELATQVEVRFDAAGEGGCTMTLIHSGWDHQPDGHNSRGSYDTGWDMVLGRFVVSLTAAG